MNKVIEWFTSWYHTLEIKFRHPELYRYLCDYTDNPSTYDGPIHDAETGEAVSGYVEVQRPNFRTWEQYKADNPDFPSFQSKDGEDL